MGPVKVRVERIHNRTMRGLSAVSRIAITPLRSVLPTLRSVNREGRLRVGQKIRVLDPIRLVIGRDLVEGLVLKREARYGKELESLSCPEHQVQKASTPPVELGMYLNRLSSVQTFIADRLPLSRTLIHLDALVWVPNSMRSSLEPKSLPTS